MDWPTAAAIGVGVGTGVGVGVGVAAWAALRAGAAKTVVGRAKKVAVAARNLEIFLIAVIMAGDGEFCQEIS